MRSLAFFLLTSSAFAATWPLDALEEAFTVRGTAETASGVSGKSLKLDGASLIELKDSAKLGTWDNGSAAILDDITNKALTRLSEILENNWSGDAKEDAIMMDAVRLTLTTQLRVDDSRLKKRANDTLAQLLARMDREDANLKIVNA